MKIFYKTLYECSVTDGTDHWSLGVFNSRNTTIFFCHFLLHTVWRDRHLKR